MDAVMIVLTILALLIGGMGLLYLTSCLLFGTVAWAPVLWLVYAVPLVIVDARVRGSK